MTGKPRPPRPLPDRMFSIAKRFVQRYPGADVMLARFRQQCEDDMAWMEANIDAHTLTISCWYGDDREACVLACKPLAAALAEWDRHQ